MASIRRVSENSSSQQARAKSRGVLRVERGLRLEPLEICADHRRVGDEDAVVLDERDLPERAAREQLRRLRIRSHGPVLVGHALLFEGGQHLADERGRGDSVDDQGHGFLRFGATWRAGMTNGVRPGGQRGTGKSWPERAPRGSYLLMPPQPQAPHPHDLSRDAGRVLRHEEADDAGDVFLLRSGS